MSQQAIETRGRSQEATTLTCLYCKRTGSAVRVSEQHIFPEAFGKGPSLRKEVCAACNHRINQEVERPVINGLTTLRAILRLEGKRGKAPALPVKTVFRGAVCRIEEQPDAIGGRLLVFKITDPKSGKKSIAFIGPPEAVQKAQKQYQRRHPKATWDDIGEEHKEVQFEVGMDFGLFGQPPALWLAGKIALEWWCHHLGVRTLDGYEYDPIREFVLTGEQAGPSPVWVVADEAVIKSMQPNFGIHSILLSTHPSSRDVVAVVGLFGLVYYKVVLTRLHSVLAAYQKMVYFNPQRDEPYEPPIHAKLTNFPLHRYTPLDRLEPMDAIRRIHARALERLNAGLRQIGIIKELSGVTTSRT